MINVIGITNENQLEKDVPIDTAAFSKYKWVWVDFGEPTDEEVKHLADTFHFHPLAIEDCLQMIQRPKLDYYDDYTFYITHHVREEEKDIVKEELDFFVSDNFIVTFHLFPSQEVDYVWERLLSQKNSEQWDTHHVFYKILDKIVDNYFPIIYQIEVELANIEDNTQKKATNDVMPKLFDIRHMLLSLMQTVNPMRDLLYRMLNSQHLEGVKRRRAYFSDIHDDLLKVSELIMSNREVTTDMRDSYLSMNSHQTNNVMKILTIITSIFSPLTLLAGIYGMNFQNMPELRWQYGYFLALGLMGIIGVSMYLWIRKKGWFK
ncbi:magnesium/cobalt transport protein cora [Trichococcus palustris]|jgi:magnesium transporter|uniref:Magnesium transport protein CorA n=1 Tax=Trichococcus palustris TaxID=140314 RepID=A0A143YPE8_9LACT|nr:magnesium/cobalt transporter CorA [Trichococcus palustris]CZQ93659.1 magnesium/cobalt transport protein cora [Trichococcus palustris]SFK83461.1 magnesium transporter [Trichococcus palustris]